VASPVAHSFAGYWVFQFFAAQSKFRLLRPGRGNLLPLGILVVVANLPDFDFFLSLAIRGNLNDLHHGFTHSLPAAAFISVVLTFAWPIAATFWRSALVYFTAYSSHLLIDLCTGARLGWNNTGFGIPLFWPLSQHYSSPLILMIGVQHEELSALWSLQNVASGMYELAVCGAITAVFLVIRARYVHDG
jgi:membrane-bound metal-dependent hydrolase YbcI (DUF457 family)